MTKQVFGQSMNYCTFFSMQKSESRHTIWKLVPKDCCSVNAKSEKRGIIFQMLSRQPSKSGMILIGSINAHCAFWDHI